MQPTYRLRGRVYFNDGRKSLPCFIRDIFYEGARIVLPQRTKIPDLIELHVPKKHRVVQASVRWCHGNTLGLAFSDAGHLKPKRSRLNGHP